MKVRNPIAEHVHVYLLRGGRPAYDGGDPRQRGPQRRCLRPVEVGDEGNVAVGFEMCESDNNTVKHDRQTPVLVLPNPAAAKIHVRVGGTAQQALIDCRLISVLRTAAV